MSSRSRRHKIAFAGAIIGLSAVAIGGSGPWSLHAHAQEIGSLSVGAVVDGAIAPRESHRYGLVLRAQRCATVFVEQRGVDVVVQTVGADGQAIAEFQDEVGGNGQERVEIAPDVDGTYTLVIAAAPGTTVAGSYAVRMSSPRACTDADRWMQEARRLRTAAQSLFERDRTEEAMPLVERALQLTEAARGPDDEQTAMVLAQLAAVYMDLPDFANAETRYLRALAILDRTRGARSPVAAFTRSRLATLYDHMGQRPRAEALLGDATSIIERTLGPEHLWYVRCLGTLSSIRANAGDLEQAADLLRRQLAILEKIDYDDTILFAGVLNNLGGVYGRSRDYAKSEAYLQRAVALAAKLRGPDDYFLSNPLVNLGVVARQRRDLAAAEAYYLRALAIRQRIVGEDGPELGLILNNLANVYQATGDYRRALDMHFRALRVTETAFGPYHHNTLLSVGNIARASLAAGDIATAIAYQRRADTIIEKQLTLNLSVGSERQKQLFVRSLAERTDRTISLHLDRAPDNPDAAKLAALVQLQRKGRVLDAMRDTLAVVRRTASQADQDLLAQLNTTTTELAELALRTAEPAGRQARQNRIVQLQTTVDHLEAALAERSAEFRAELQSVTLESVQNAIPDDAALVEFGVFRSYDPAAERTADAYGVPHYAAYIIRQFGTPLGVDLGDAHAIDAKIAMFREMLRNPHRQNFEPTARELFDCLMRPIAAAYGDARRLLISPDGNLNLLPFEALIDEQGRYVVQRHAVTYLTSGRDLLRRGVRRAAANPPVVIANPLFGEPTGATRAATYFAPLPGSAAEAQSIKMLFPRATILTGSRATKTAILQLRAPAVLHVASHGFFVDGGDPSPPVALAGAGARGASGSISVRNPLLRSGVALAGANVPRGGHDDGILTALEASHLNLWGTQLVTLSACDTGIGEVRDGEGVYGLRRAFVLAGAESLVMSLWPVSDAVARETMVSYYRGLRAGVGRADALRQTKLAMMQRPGRRHPFYWAGFIQSGDWGALNQAR